MTYRVDFKADRAVKKIQIIEMNKDRCQDQKTAYISPEIKQYQMQKDTAYVIINEQLIGMKVKRSTDRRYIQQRRISHINGSSLEMMEY